MNTRLDISRNRRDGVTVPTIWVTIALSLLIHAAALWEWFPRVRLLSLERPEWGEAGGPLTVQLAPLPGNRPTPPRSPALQAQPSPAPGARPPKAAVRPRPAPPVIALDRRDARLPSPPPAAPASARPPADGDLASYVEARRRARGESAPVASPGSAPAAPPTEDDDARANRIAAANIASQRPQTFGYDPSQGGGMFQIKRMGYDYAEFMFFGWNKEIRRKTAQLIEVQKGSNSDIRIAVVRRMISIIREHEQGDFLWESPRLGRDVTLSARPKDNAGLEDFMMNEFFANQRLPQ